MKAKVGLYHFCHKRNMWSVYQYTTVNENGSTARHIEDYGHYEDAVKAIYHLNGWGEPKNTTKIF